MSLRSYAIATIRKTISPPILLKKQKTSYSLKNHYVNNKKLRGYYWGPDGITTNIWSLIFNSIIGQSPGQSPDQSQGLHQLWY